MGSGKIKEYRQLDGRFMSKETYDPSNIEADAFDMENMVEGADANILTDDERSDITGIYPDRILLTGTGTVTVDCGGHYDYYYVMSSDTTFSLTNLKQGAIITILVTGAFNPTFPAGTEDANSDTYDSAKNTLYTFFVQNETGSYIRFWASNEA